MNKLTTSMSSLLLLVLLSGTLLTACGQAVSAASQNTAAPSQLTSGLDGQGLLQERCSVCHSARVVTRLRGTADQWKGLVDAMINAGAQLNPQEEQVLVNYLAQTYHQ
jgi:hypothetical protein